MLSKATVGGFDVGGKHRQIAVMVLHERAGCAILSDPHALAVKRHTQGESHRAE